MISKGNSREYFKIEMANAISHGLGVFLGIIFLLMLIIPSVKSGNVLKVVAFSIYGGCFIFLFLMSTIYHAVQREKIKKILRIFDHVSIYYFIAGSFTPVILLLTRGRFRLFFIILIWAIALFGTVFKITTYKNYDKLKTISVIIYIAMGWLSVFLIKPIVTNTTWKFMFLLVLGGLVYTGGTYFYKSKRFKYSHVIWHFFVLAASIIHFIAFYLYI
ncbi:MAG: hemolysin III family protein [Peptoniphilus harei]|uniref:PAQR family membrane homeostasis protein TrhA n=1 Tax=Peptoniphilaceae TaxID=1570339 RepID=UPI0025508315|nr:hemolysin III family protein [Peptoniphilus harei]MDU4448130.1 hemolysin III family protein [Anaerococcus vaginalis]MDK7755000.1 hemolysin III family protein [Peptoniphilus harei]MDK7760807.1 hemolysin III family protein [Peptoniphilus harei]MDK8270597.1 hemolysin III family protein [Peptoniphilus harei]MDK8338981.1 hemolysin III family protein [Peptoniphilus harei]